MSRRDSKTTASSRPTPWLSPSEQRTLLQHIPPPDTPAALDLIRRTFESMPISFTDTTLSKDIVEDRPLCLLSLCNAMSYVFGQERIIKISPPDLISKLPVDYPAVINAMTHFVFTQTSITKLRSSGNRLAVCSCDMTDELVSTLHNPPTRKFRHLEPIFDPMRVENPGEKPMGRLGSITFRVLHSVLLNIELSRLGRMQARAVASKSRDRDDGYMGLLYYFTEEPQSTMHSAVAWYEAYRCVSVTELLAIDGSHLHNLTWSLMYSEPKALFRLVDLCLDDIERVYRGCIERKDSIGATEVRNLAYSNDVKQIGMLVSAPFRSDQEIPSHIPSSLLRRMYRRFCFLLELWAEEERTFNGAHQLDDITRLLLAWPASDLFTVLGQRNALDDEIGYRVHPLARNHATKTAETASETPFSLLMSGFHLMKKEKRCMNLRCKKSPPENTKAFPLCTGCKFFVYCSKECQRQAWAIEPAPHRELCRAVGVLSSVWGKTMNQTETLLTSFAERKGSVSMGDLDTRLEEVAMHYGYDREKVDFIWKRWYAFDTLLNSEMDLPLVGPGESVKIVYKDRDSGVSIHASN